MRVKVILNPASDQGRGGQYVDQIVTAGQKWGGVDLESTKQKGHAEQLARVAAEDGYDLVVAAGGDGTVHEVVNGLMRAEGSKAVLGVIPIGSGNDFAYALDTPLDLTAAVERLFNGKPKLVDLGRVEDGNGRCAYFDNNLGIGFDATVVVRTEAITRIHGFLMYFVAVLQTIVLYFKKPYLTLQFDDEKVAQRVLFLALGIGPRGGGGFFLTPDARQDDDLIDSCTVNIVSRLTMLQMLGKAIKGTHTHSRHVTMRKSKHITVSSDSELPIHVDGEMFAYPEDNVRQLTITSVPNAIKVMSNQ